MTCNVFGRTLNLALSIYSMLLSTLVGREHYVFGSSDVCLSARCLSLLSSVVH